MKFLMGLLALTAANAFAAELILDGGKDHLRVTCKAGDQKPVMRERGGSMLVSCGMGRGGPVEPASKCAVVKGVYGDYSVQLDGKPYYSSTELDNVLKSYSKLIDSGVCSPTAVNCSMSKGVYGDYQVKLGENQFYSSTDEDKALDMLRKLRANQVCY